MKLDFSGRKLYEGATRKRVGWEEGGFVCKLSLGFGFPLKHRTRSPQIPLRCDGKWEKFLHSFYINFMCMCVVKSRVSLKHNGTGWRWGCLPQREIWWNTGRTRRNWLKFVCKFYNFQPENLRRFYLTLNINSRTFYTLE